MATDHQISLLLLLCYTTMMISLDGVAGITADLILRDSSSTNSHVDRLHKSILRAHAITRASLIPTGDEYLLDIAIGYPPSRFLAIVDSGSDLTWTQCQPCAKCFKQDLPLFNPAKSSSYTPLACDSSACGALSDAQRECGANNTCLYNYNYDDSSFTRGNLSTETLTIGGRPIPGFAFGCGYTNQGTFTRHASGLIGLGQGPLSLPSQTKKNSAFGGKFAYCFIPFAGEFQEGARSKISFGGDAAVTGPGVVSTAVVPGPVDTFYYLNLEGVSVGDKTVPFKKEYRPGHVPGPNGPGEGNIIIDSGTTLTFLPQAMLDGVMSELKSQVKAKPVPDPFATLKLCYEKSVSVPSMKFQFAGATLEMGAVNTFVRMTENVSCLAMLPARDLAIFGNMAHINFLVSYDIDAKMVRFKPTDCTKYV